MVIQFILIAIIFILAAYFSVIPLFQPAQTITMEMETMETLQLKKRVLYREIKELDIDFELGNIAQSDYTKSRDDLKRNVSEVIQEIKQIRT